MDEFSSQEIDYNSLKFPYNSNLQYDPVSPGCDKNFSQALSNKAASSESIPAAMAAPRESVPSLESNLDLSAVFPNHLPADNPVTKPVIQGTKRKVPDSFLSLRIPPKTPRHNVNEEEDIPTRDSKKNCDNCDCVKDFIEKSMEKVVEQISLKLIKVAEDQTKDLKKSIQDSKTSLKSTFHETCLKLQENIAIVYEKLDNSGDKLGSLEPAIIKTLHSSATALAELCLQQGQC